MMAKEERLSRRLSPEAETLLAKYSSLLLKWNKRMNLSGARSQEELEDLFEDSFALADFLKTIFPSPSADFSAWDLGAGAGLPGIPLRAVWMEGNYWLVESRQKRALFLENALAALNLPRTRVFNGRAEKFFTAINRKADCIISRAFMPQDKLLCFCAPHLAPSGVIIIMSGEDGPAIPKNWLLLSQAFYPTARGRRWLRALSRGSHESAN